ncbi:MAG: dUTP diphosphatase [Spirochaetaceae bacterium]|nr:dUTP diphosphatase [Spirochaetaceae bacterium]
MQVKIKKLHPRAILPSFATPGSAGADLSALLDAPLVLQPGERALIPSGIAMELPPAYECQLRPRSGLAAKFGVTVLNAPGTIDSDFRGELKALLINHGTEPFTINSGDRIAQLVVQPVIAVEYEEADSLSDTKRGEGGYGSTGR